MFELYTGQKMILSDETDKKVRKEDYRGKIVEAAHKATWVSKFQASHFATPEALELMKILLHQDPSARGEVMRLVKIPYFAGLDFEKLPLRSHDMPFLPEREESNCDGTSAVMDAFEEDQLPTCKEYIAKDNEPFVDFEYNTRKMLDRKTNKLRFSRMNKNTPVYAKRRKPSSPNQRRVMSHQQRRKSGAYFPDLNDARSTDSQQSNEDSAVMSYKLHESARGIGVNRLSQSARTPRSARKSNSLSKSSQKLEAVGEGKESITNRAQMVSLSNSKKILPESQLRKPDRATDTVTGSAP